MGVVSSCRLGQVSLFASQHAAGVSEMRKRILERLEFPKHWDYRVFNTPRQYYPEVCTLVHINIGMDLVFLSSVDALHSQLRSHREGFIPGAALKVKACDLRLMAAYCHIFNVIMSCTLTHMY